MGQRHQIYLRLPAKYYNEGNVNNRDAQTVGLHHQWLYGKTALESLSRALTFFKERLSDKFYKEDPFFNPAVAAKALQCLYSVNPATGYFHNTHILRESNDDEGWSSGGKEGWHPECQAPENGDNNDGITVIDISGDKIRYAFVSIGHIEGEGKQPAVGKPLTAKEYFDHYYPAKTRNEKSDLDDLKWFAEGDALAEFIDSFELLTTAELKKIFPKSKLFKAERQAAKRKSSKGLALA